MTPVAEANKIILNRYINILSNLPNGDPDDITSPCYLISMCNTILANPQMYDDKQSRWLGCIQGIMLCKGLLDRDMERDVTRGVFHDAYRAMGLDIPESISIFGSQGVLNPNNSGVLDD